MKKRPFKHVVKFEGIPVDSDDDDDIGDAFMGHGDMPPYLPGLADLQGPKVKSLRWGGDSDSDSDSELQTKKPPPTPPTAAAVGKKKIKSEAGSVSTAGAASTAIVVSKKKAPSPPTTTPPTSAVAIVGKKKGKGAKDKPNGAEQHKMMYKSSMVARGDESKIIKLQDFLQQGELSVGLMSEMEKMYGDSAWDSAGVAEDKPLFNVDLDDQNRMSLMHKGVFYNPRLFSLIRVMLERNTEGKFSTHQLQNNIANLYNIEPVPREYEETMLSTPKDNERPCCNGTGCQAFKWWGFIMKEFITPLELAEIKQTSTRNNVVKLCLVCVRKSIDFMQTSSIINGLRSPENYINQSHRNEVNKKGQYTSEYSIPLGNGIIYPVIMNNKLAYVHHTDGKMHWVTQDGYRQCTQEDIDQQNFHTGTLRQKKTRKRKLSKAAANAAAAAAAAAETIGGAGLLSGRQYQLNMAAAAAAAAASTKLDPSISKFFCASRRFPHDLEECLYDIKRGENIVTYFYNLPLDPWHISFGHPTLALIHYFKLPDINYPPDTGVGSYVDSDQFILSLYTVLLVPNLVDTRHLSRVTVSGCDKDWICPCGNDSLVCGSLCMALKTRLSILQTTIRILRFNARPVLVNHAYAHLDAHMPLMCAVKSFQTSLSGNPRDVCGVKDYACSDKHMAALVEHAPIDICWSYTEEGVPDTSPLLLLSISYNNNTKGVSNKRIFQSKFPHLNNANIIRIHKLVNLIYKGLPNRCNNRQLWNFIRRCCISTKPKKKVHSKRSAAAAGAAEENDVFEIDADLVEFFCKLLVASVLGIYSQSRDKMDDLNCRQNIYNLLHAPVPTSQILGVMNPQNRITLLYITKEYLRAMTDRSPGVLEGLKKGYEWGVYDRDIDDITSIVRTTVQNNMRAHQETMTSLNDIFKGADARITAIHDESRRSQREKTVNYDVHAIIKSLNDTNLKSYVAQNNDNGEFTGKEFLMISPHPVISPELTELMRQLIRTFPSHHWVPLDWLVCFGVSWRDITAVRDALFKKMTVLTRLLKKINSVEPYAYAIFYTFFRLCKEHRDYREYYADAHMYLSHARALNVHHGIAAGSEIPPVLGKLKVCPTCGDFKRPSFFRPLKRNKNGGGIGIMRICLDGRIVCGRKIKRAGWRAKKTANRKQRQLRLTASKKTAPKKRGRRRATPAGGDDDVDINLEEDEDEEYAMDEEFDPLEELDQEFGITARRGDADDDDELQDDDDDDEEFMFEEKKGGLMQPSERTKKRKIAKFIATQHVLYECQDTELLTINTLGRVAEWQRQIMISCMKCVRTITLLSATDFGSLKLCQDCYFKESTSMRTRIKCEAPGCKRKIQTKADFKVFYAYDDTLPVGERVFRDMILCSLHNGFGWLKWAPAILPVSVIMKGLGERWATKSGPKNKYIEVPAFDKVLDV